MKIKLIAVILAATVTLYGASYAATVVNYKVNVNDQPLSTTVLNLNGSTYLSVRSVSEAVGVPISWNNTTKSVEINTLDVDKLKESCVMIIASNGESYDQGSGTYIDYQTVLTAYHAVDDGRTQIRTAVDKNDINKMTVISSAPAIDVALLKTTVERKPVKIGDSDEVQIGDKVILISSPAGKANTITYCTVKDITDRITISTATNGGSSGGGLFTTNGELIGILISGDDGLKECYITPINLIRKSL